jgi:hypothetical protein
VLLAIAADFAVACADSIAEPASRSAVLDELGRDGREVIVIDTAEMNGFAGNLLALRARGGESLVAMSEVALRALAPEKRRRIERHGTIVAVAIPTIERLGGGSVRCMLAEVFLPRVAGPT